MPLQYIRCCICVILLVGCSINSITAQSYLYANKELIYDNTKEYVKLMTTDDGFIHVWMWGNGWVTQDIYNSKLQFQYRNKYARYAGTLLFLPFSKWYYVLMIGPQFTKVYQIWGDNYHDRTAEMNNIPLGDGPIHFIEPGESNLNFIQYSRDDSGQNRIQITTVDSNLRYQNALALNVKFSSSELRRLKLFTMGNRLLMVNTKVFDSTTALTIHQVDILKSKVTSNSIQFDNEIVSPVQVLPSKNGWLIEGHASKPINTVKRQTAYTYLLQLDSSLHLQQHFYTAQQDTSLEENRYYLYMPVTTQLLPSRNVLTVDYLRSLDTKTKKMDMQLRCYWLDSGFSVVKSFVKPTQGYNNYPAYLFSKGSEVFAYYEEEIKRDVVTVHSWKLNDNVEDDRILQLNPKNRYLLRKAVRTSDNTFVMPYQRNYKFGLVKVHVTPAQSFD